MFGRVRSARNIASELRTAAGGGCRPLDWYSPYAAGRAVDESARAVSGIRGRRSDRARSSELRLLVATLVYGISIRAQRGC